MTQEKPKRGVGRPKAEINWNKVDTMLAEGCYGTHIADSMGMDNLTLYRACEREKNMNFEAYARQKKSNGDSCIQQAQYKLAVEQQNATMLIWLGKQRLGQKESKEDTAITPEQIAKFSEIMSFLAARQASALSNADNNISSEQKS